LTRHFIRKFQTLSIIALFVAGIGALSVFATPAIAQNPVPFIDQPLVPDATAPGGAGFTLTVNGAWFVATSVVNWNGSPRATTFVSSSQLTAAILASDIATASSAAVTVVNPSPGGGVSNTLFLSITAVAASVSFVPVVTYSSGGTGLGAYSIAVADVDGDGIPDLLVVSCSAGVFGCGSTNGAVGVLLGNGDGTFRPVVTYDAGGMGTGSIAVAGLNGDGKLDLVVANGNSSTVGVLLGNGDGTFQPVVIYGSGGSGPQSLVVADVNGDGKPDILVVNMNYPYEELVGVLLGNGDGTFQPAMTYSSGGYSLDNPSALAVADLNGDGKPDLAVTNACGSTSGGCSGNGSVGVLLGNGDGTFQTAVNYGSGAQTATSVAIADVNGDGKPDLLVANSDCIYPHVTPCGQSTIGVLLGKGDGTFQPVVLYGSGDGGDSVAAADVNGDGKPDLVVANVCVLNAAGDCSGSSGSAASVLLGNGDGTFQPAQTYGSGGDSLSGFASTALAVGDLNGDGKPDLAVMNSCGGTSDCLGYAAIGVLLNNTGAAPTRTRLASSLNPSNYGQSVILTASVSSTAGTPTGTAVFSDASSTTTLGTATLVSGSASISVSSLAAGSHSITATYQGSLTFASNTSVPLKQVVNPATTTTSLVSSANPARVEQTVIYTAIVTSQYGGAATGTVTFADGGATIATVALSGNQAAYSTSYRTAGIRPITAIYSGDASNGGGLSAVLTEEIGHLPYPSKTTLTTSGSPSLVGQLVTFATTVTSIDGAIPNGETVTFYDGASAIGAGTTAGGVAIFTTSSLTGKTHYIKATYAGDATFIASTGSVKQVVDKYATTTTLSSTPNPSNYGQAVTLTARVTSAGPAPTGSVTFKNGSASLGVVTLNGGVATFTTAKIPVGANTLTSTYNEDAFNGKSVSPVITQTVNQASVSMALTSTPDPSTFGKSVKFTARLTSNGGLPAGQPVTFSYNGAILGTANATSTGVATFSTITLPAGGSDVVTAAYAGSADYSSASASVTQGVN
jgi:hypothetical protein